MGDLKDKSIHLTAEKLAEEIKGMKVYKDFYKDLQVKHCRKKNVMEHNKVFEIIKLCGRYVTEDLMQWEKRIHKSLNSMCTEIGVSLSRFRLASDRDELSDKWNELSTYDIDLASYRPVYAPKDFLEVLLWIRSPNYRPIDGEGTWDFTQIPLKVKTLAELRSFYLELSRGECLLGVNANMPSHGQYPTIELERTALGEKVLACRHAPVAQEFLKKGAPRSLRGRLWAQVMGSEVRAADKEYFNELKQMVLQYDLMVDKLIIKDVQLTASNDDQYFVFEDVLYQVLLCFSRDTEILSVYNHSCGSPIHGVLKSKPATLENTVVYPPSGVIPFHGFTMYGKFITECSAYFSYVIIYYLLFLLKYSFEFDTNGINANRLHIFSVRIVFKWLMRSFSGYLPPEQLLYLWDIVVAYDSLEITSLLAVAILSFRKHNLFQVDNMQGIEAVLADLSSIQVLSLLQMALMPE
ncbi:TBC1 domain family member 19 [Nilaparvata lugens]|uniref:TBC1 domain family member 19 n=1 Tax=Nilaparvata lugens TaxID=108931 RepID=UPI00193CD6B1|nr:TBC1 domain family member 19 [Nilaparvata lugens]